MQEQYEATHKSLRKQEVEKLGEDMDRIHHRNRGEKDRNHRTHDVDGVAKGNQKTHRIDNADHGDDHRSDDQFDISKEIPQQQEDNQSGNRCRPLHLCEHLIAEGILGNW